MNNPFQGMLNRYANTKESAYPVGTWIMSASPIVAEATAHAGFDWALIDMEHTPLDMMEIIHLLQALAVVRADGSVVTPIVRLPWNDTITTKRVLDAGARTLMFPFVQNADEAKLAVSSVRYPPEGIRGMAAMSRGSQFGTIKDYFKVANRAISVIVQIESPQAVERAEEIAATVGVDAAFIGPGDLSGSMGHVGDLMHKEVLALTQKAVDRVHKMGKPIGTVGGTPEAVATYRKMGFDFIACGSDMGLLMRHYSSILTAIRASMVENHSVGY